MRIAVIGAGAMGSFFAAKLSPLAEVWLISRWQQQVDAINNDGLNFTNMQGREIAISLQATTNPQALIGSIDIALITVKTPDTVYASAIARLLLKSTGITISLQNGLGNTQIIKGYLPPYKVTQGVTSIGVTLLGPGKIKQAGDGPTHLATTPQTKPLVLALSHLLRQTNLEINVTDNLESLIWGKLIINVGLNALTAILRVPTGKLQGVEPAQNLVREAVQEAVSVAQAKQIPLPYTNPQAQVQRVIQATATNRTSMLADIIRGVPTEIDAINGAIVSEGEKLGIQTPINQTLVWLIKSLEQTVASRV
ncbi:MAG: 2-dehydropantoate 2-reductase [Chloroflexota bacterium]